AANETLQGQASVAQVILNRMRHPAYPKTVCGVVFQGSERTTGCQFSFTCDGAMGRPPSAEGWARARAVAASALNGFVAADVGMATHYHANYV
ncbi:cell wall hydrolase, partial [Staphylococcus epidermidis]|uniref:cell wall hydrolase n=1 Tax=Staphylococcus epidermidis TaxID=1282 RepID=UPI0039E1D9CB